MICRRAARSLAYNNNSDQAFVNLSLWLKRYNSSIAATETAKISPESTVTAQSIPVNPASKKTKRSQSLEPKDHTPGSRRSKAAIKSSLNVPFEKLPYQCFQEARKVLQIDREQKMRQIQTERQRIARLSERDASEVGGEQQKSRRLESMRRYLEQLKILADINNPIVKKKFEDGHGDMTKPIYRFLADRKWRSYKRLLTMQRISQFNVVPDILHKLEPTAEVGIGFGRRKEALGEIVPSKVSKTPGNLFIKLFDKGERLVTVALIDPDVPVLETDGFEYRCHFLAVNIPVSPTVNFVRLESLSEDSHVIFPWLPPYAQKGSPYHRLAFFVLEHAKGNSIDVSQARDFYQRKNFKLRSFMDKFSVTPIGFDIFRTQWDAHMDQLMHELGVEGIDMELRKTRFEPLPYKKKDGSRFR